MRAAYHTVLNPPSLKVTIEIDGDSLDVRSSGIGISNNLFGEGHLPYADAPDGGVLGSISRSRARRASCSGSGWT